MDMDALKAQLIQDERMVDHVYFDPGHHETFCVGHLKTPKDKVRRGEKIPLARCHELLQQDIATAIAACEHIWPTFHAVPDEGKVVLISVAYTIGEAKMRRMTTLIRAIEQAQWEAAARALTRYRWYHQVGDRGKRLVARLRALGGRG